MVTIRVGLDPVDKNEEPVMNQRQNAVESANVILPAERDINTKAYVEQVRRMEVFLENMKVAPYIVNGKKEGLCITGLDDLDMARNFGFENADVIQTINGQMLTNKQKAFQVLKKGRSQSSLNFRLLRNKQKMDLSFEIR
jgi:type II secretory pathway component PulC